MQCEREEQGNFQVPEEEQGFMEKNSQGIGSAYPLFGW